MPSRPLRSGSRADTPADTLAATFSGPAVANPPPGGLALQVSEHRLLLAAGDLIALTLGVLVALWVWTLTAGASLSPAFIASKAYWLLAIPAWFLVLTPSRRVRASLSVEQTVATLTRAAGVLSIAYLALYFYAPRQALPRLVALWVLWEGVLFMLAWRLTYIWLFTETGLRRRLLIVGTGDAAQRARTVIEAELPHATLIGFVADDTGHDPAASPPVDGVIGTHTDLSRLVSTERVSEIVLAVKGPMHAGLVQALMECQQLGVDLVPLATLYESLLQRVPVDSIPADWLFTSLVDTVRTRDASRILKRAVDAAGGLAGLILCAVAWPFVALAVAIDSGRPVHYRQLRVGQGGRLFPLVKFRTMSTDAEADGPRWADPNDARVTRVGRWLRRSRLDELPQFLHVLRGEMSLVGPRPERPEFVAMLADRIPFYRTRLIVRPGLTGWAQVNHPYGDSVEDARIKLEYDLYYLKHRSMLFDFVILARTFGTVARLKGT